MSLILPLLLFVIIIACVACLFIEGMWGNAIRLINVVTAALLATNFFEPVAAWLEGMGDWFASFTYLWDFLALWGLFGVFMILFRLVTNHLSRVKVRFLKIADHIGSAFFAAWIGWVMVCFSMFSLHTAPLARKFMSGAFQAEKRMFMGLAPDRQWLGFVQKVSRGQFCRAADEEDLRELPKQWKQWKAQWTGDKTRTFDPCSEFMPKYATRRANLEAYNNQHKAIRINPKLLSK